MTQAITSFAGLEDLRSRLMKLPETRARIAQRVAARFSELAQHSFDAQQSPYGDAWGPGEDGKPLDLNVSGKLRSEALRYTSTGTAVRASVGAVPYARYQLKHGILPKKGAIPQAWHSEVKRIAEEELRKAMGDR